MLKAQDFFELSDHPLASLFDDTEYVWEALTKLKQYIRQSLSGNVAAIRNGDCMITKTVILYGGRVITDGFVIDSSGKKPAVRKDG